MSSFIRTLKSTLVVEAVWWMLHSTLTECCLMFSILALYTMLFFTLTLLCALLTTLIFLCTLFRIVSRVVCYFSLWHCIVSCLLLWLFCRLFCNMTQLNVRPSNHCSFVTYVFHLGVGSPRLERFIPISSEQTTSLFDVDLLEFYQRLRDISGNYWVTYSS